MATVLVHMRLEAVTIRQSRSAPAVKLGYTRKQKPIRHDLNTLGVRYLSLVGIATEIKVPLILSISVSRNSTAIHYSELLHHPCDVLALIL
jgi:hypothetical protein